jgi:phosphotransferase system HPr (HPr) family protein
MARHLPSFQPDGRSSTKIDLITFMNAVVSARSTAGPLTTPGIPKVRRTFVVDLQHGLHARPCAMLVKAVRPFSVTVDVEANGEKASGKSILGLMALAAAAGTRITFTIVGENAYQAMADVGRLFDNRFEAKA